jgi:hypothetical protein
MTFTAWVVLFAFSMLFHEFMNDISRVIDPRVPRRYNKYKISGVRRRRSERSYVWSERLSPPIQLYGIDTKVIPSLEIPKIPPIPPSMGALKHRRRVFSSFLRRRFASNKRSCHLAASCILRVPTQRLGRVAAAGRGPSSPCLVHPVAKLLTNSLDLR